MTVKERIIAIRLTENIRRNSEYAKSIGVSAEGLRKRNDGKSGKSKEKSITPTPFESAGKSKNPLYQCM